MRSVALVWHSRLVNAVPASDAGRLLGNSAIQKMMREDGGAPGCGAEICGEGESG